MTQATQHNSALFDSQERNAALNVEKSFIVQAPAGSGKTELLIQRILNLLCCVKKPEEILAITFTKKAANEMRLRVINALKSSKKAKPTSAHAEKTWYLAIEVMKRDEVYGWGLLQNPNQLNIQTIDSLCSYLTMHLPLLSQFGAPPRIIEQPQVVYEKTVDDLLLHLEEASPWQKPLATLLLHLDNNILKVKELLINLLSKRDQWIPYLKYTQSSSGAKEQLEHYLKRFIEEKLSNLYRLFPANALQTMSRLACHCAYNLDQLGKENHLAVFKENDATPSATIKDLPKWVALASFMLTKKGEFRKKADSNNGFFSASHFKKADEKASHDAMKKEYIATLQSLQENDMLQIALAETLLLPKPFYSPSQWKILFSLLEILKILLAQLRVSFQENGQIDFIENTQAALLALGDDEHPTNLTLALDYQLKHILIDEFQDTSITQFQLLEKLITGWEPHDGRSLFIVGDPMQSIYRFRDAEVGLFIKIWTQGLKNKPLERLSLSVNFRSTNRIVDWNNQHFSQAFPEIDLISDGAVSFSQSKTPDHQHTPHSFIDVLSCDNSQQDDESIVITDKIRHIKATHPHDNIAILVRSRSHIKTIIPALKKARIDFQAAEIDNLYSKQSIKDLITLTHALFDLSNKTAWLALLRAPWCGLSLADLYKIASGEHSAILWYRLLDEKMTISLSETGKAQLSRILPILKLKIAERDRVDLSNLIESTWMLLGGPACLDENTTQSDIEFFFDLIKSIEKTISPSRYQQFEELIKKSYSSSNEMNSNVMIMTIHAAKGLEFDTVIIPHLEKILPHHEKELLAWLEYPLSNDTTALLLAPLQASSDKSDPLHAFIHRQQKIKLDYEVDRLLYVAATRAKKRLIFSFSTNVGDDCDTTHRSGSFLQKLWPYIKNEQQRIALSSTTAIENLPAQPKKLLRRLTVDWQNPMQYNVKQQALHRQSQGFSLKNDTPRLVGSIIHAILQLISKNTLLWWHSIHDTRKEKMILSYMHFFNVPVALQQEAIKKIIVDLYKVTNDPIGQWILAAHKEAQSEYALSMHELTESNIVIDRTFIDEQDRRWIIDYKTMDTLLTDIDQHVDTYKTQLIRYRDAFSQQEKREIKLGLYFTALPAWKEVTPE